MKKFTTKRVKPPRALDVRKMIRDVTAAEGGKTQQDIAQIGETIRNTLIYLATADPVEAELTLRKYRPDTVPVVG